MPRKRKTNDQTVAGRNENGLIDTSFEPLSGNHMGSAPDMKGSGQSVWPHFPTHSGVEKENLFQYFQEMFAGKLDAEIVYMILTECDWKVDDAMEKLMQLTPDSDNEDTYFHGRQNESGMNAVSQVLFRPQAPQTHQHQFRMPGPDQRNQGPFLMHSDQKAESKQAYDHSKHLQHNMYPHNSVKDMSQVQRPSLALNIKSRLPSVPSSEHSSGANNLTMLSPRTPRTSRIENAEPLFPTNTDSESVQSAMQALDSFANNRGADLNSLGFGPNTTMFNQGNGFIHDRQLPTDSLPGHQPQASVNEMTGPYPHMKFHDETQTSIQRPVPMMQNPTGASLTSQSNIPLPKKEMDSELAKQQDINGNEFAQLAARNKLASKDEKVSKGRLSANSEGMKTQRLKHKKQMQNLRHQHISLDPTERESLEKLIEEVIIDGIGKDAIFDDDDSSESDTDSTADSSGELGEEKTVDGKSPPQANLKVAAKHMKNLPPRFLRRLQDNKGGKLTEEAFELLQFEQIPEEVEIPEIKEKVKHDSGGKKPKRTRYFLEGADQYMDDSLLRENVEDKNRQLDTSLDDETFLQQDPENLENLCQLTPVRSPKPGKIEGQYPVQRSDNKSHVTQGTINVHELEEHLLNAGAHPPGSDIRQIGMEAANYQTLFSVNAPEFVPKSKTPTSEMNQAPPGFQPHVGPMSISSHAGPKIQQPRFNEASNVKQNKLSSPMPHGQMFPIVSQGHHVRTANSPVMMASEPPSVSVPVSIGLTMPTYPANYPNVVGRASPQHQLVAPRLVTSIPNAGLQSAQGRNSPAGKTFLIPKVTGPPPPPPPPPPIGVMQYQYSPYPYHAGFMPYQLRAPFIPPHGFPTTWASDKAITDPKVLKALQKANMKEKNRLQQMVNPARPNSAPTYGAPNGKQNIPGGQNPEQPTPPKQSSRRPIKLTKERLAKLLNDGNKILVLVRGCPGSGKSHLAKEMKNDGVVLSTDDFFVKENGVYEHDISRLSEAHEWNFKRAKAAMEEGKNPVFIDNTNTQAWEMKPYVRAGIKIGYNIEFLEPDTAWKSNAKELVKRNIHGVPLATIEKMLERYEPEMTVEKVLGLSELPTEEVEEIQKEMEALSLHGEPKTTRRRRKRRRKRKNKNKQASEEGGEEHAEAKAEEGSSDEEETTPERDHGAGDKETPKKETLNPSEKLEIAPNEKNINSDTKDTNKDHEPNLDTGYQEERKVSQDVNISITSPEKTESQTSNTEGDKRQFDPEMLLVLMEQTLKNILMQKGSKDLQELVKIVNEQLDRWDAPTSVREHTIKLLHDAVNHEGELNEEVAKINSGADTIDSHRTLFEKAYWQSEESLDKTQTPVKQLSEGSGEVICDIITEKPKPKRIGRRKSRGSKDDSEDDTVIPDLQGQIKTEDWSFPSQTTNIVRKEHIEVNIETQNANTQTCENDFIDSLKVANGCEFDSSSLQIIVGTPKEIFTGTCEKHPQSKSGKVMIDASSTAQEEKPTDNLDSVQFLKECFPSVSLEDLQEISQRCGHDPQWAINILLDSGYEYNEPTFKEETKVKEGHGHSASHLPIEKLDLISTPLTAPKFHQTDMERYSPPPLAILCHQSMIDHPIGDQAGTNEEQLQETCVKENVKRMRSIEEYQRKHPDEERQRNISTTSVDTTHSLDCSFDSPHQQRDTSYDVHAADGLTLMLSTGLASQLIKMFGPVGFHISQDSLAPEDLAVTLDRKTAKHIHRSWAMTLHEKFEQEEDDIEKMMKQDEAYARKLQMEEDNKTPSAQRTKLPQTFTGKTTGISVVQVNRTPPVSFKDIVAEEKKIEEGKQAFVASAEKVNDTIATRMKKQKLQELFPTYDKVLLAEIFESNGFSLQATIEVLQDIEKTREPVKTVMTKEAAAEMEEKLIQQAMEESIKDHWLGADEDVEDGPEFQTMEDPVYQDYRAEASMHYKLRHENFQKAQEAHRRKLPEVAAWYSKLGHMHTEKLKEANRRAAEMILQTRNKEFEDSNTLDLHGLHVDEAIEALKNKIQEKTQERATQPGKTKLNFAVITGRGNHSRGGKAKIKPAVIEFLTRNSVSFTELHAGLLQVNLANGGNGQ